MKKKKKSFSVKPVLLLLAAALLLLGSTVGSARAALTYYSENYSAQVNISNIGVSLNENGEKISYRDYEENGEWSQATGTLLGNFQEEKLVPGKLYQEKLTVTNSGSIDSFVRVILRKSWTGKDGGKDTTLTPELIKLNLTDDGWVVDKGASTRERTVLYYTKLLEPGQVSPAFTDTLQIDSAIGSKVTEDVTEENGYKTITTVYDYDGYRFQVEAEVNAVQTHNAREAIKSAWGVDVNVSADGKSISLAQ